MEIHISMQFPEEKKIVKEAAEISCPKWKV